MGASVQHCAPVEHWSDQYVWVIYIDAEFDCDGGGELGMGSRRLVIVHAGDLRGLLTQKRSPSARVGLHAANMAGSVVWRMSSATLLNSGIRRVASRAKHPNASPMP